MRHLQKLVDVSSGRYKARVGDEPPRAQLGRLREVAPNPHYTHLLTRVGGVCRRVSTVEASTPQRLLAPRNHAPYGLTFTCL